MPNDIKCSWLKRGFRPPEGLTWAMVAKRRARWDSADADRGKSRLARLERAHAGDVPLRHS